MNQPASSPITDQRYLQTDQYRDGANLDARARLHQRFSTSRQPWHRWVFDRFVFPDCSRILELGCGPGYLWAQNRDRIPAGWEITLSDFSPGMVHECRKALAADFQQIRYAVIDAQHLPFPTGCLDAVIANHVLFHVPDRQRALCEIRRVLAPGGRFYASTIGRDHMKELGDLVRRFAGDSRDQAALANPFLLEDGAEQIVRCFSDVRLERFADGLMVTEAGPLVAYIGSMMSLPEAVRDRPDDLARLVEEELRREGALHITKDTGLFQARRSG